MHVPALFGWLRCLIVSHGGSGGTGDRARGATTSCTSLGRFELRDRAKCSGWTALVAAVYFLWNASAVMLDGMPATADLRGGGGRWAARGKR